MPLSCALWGGFWPLGQGSLLQAWLPMQTQVWGLGPHAQGAAAGMGSPGTVPDRLDSGLRNAGAHSRLDDWPWCPGQHSTSLGPLVCNLIFAVQSKGSSPLTGQGGE